MSQEIYKRYRPKTLKEVIGQPTAVATISKMLANTMPQTIMLTGASGTGKTSVARILKESLQCSDHDYLEINAAEARGIDTVRDIKSRMTLAPFGGRSRIFLFDEAHKITGDGQNALLKTLEDTPPNVYFILATTDPQKLIATVRNRCQEIKFNPVKVDDLVRLLSKVAVKEGEILSQEVAIKIADMAEGSARKALVLLESVIHLEEENSQLEALEKSSVKHQAIELARLLMPYKGKSSWSDLAKVLKDLQDEDAEGLRHMVLAYARKVLLGTGPQTLQAYVVIQAFRDNFYDSKHAGLAVACYEVIHKK